MLTFVEGQVKPSQHHELRELRTQSQACVNAAVDGCNLGRNELCPNGSTLLLPLTGPATCANINRAEFGMLDAFPTTVDCRAKTP